jgi:hypothetical protein
MSASAKALLVAGTLSLSLGGCYSNSLPKADLFIHSPSTAAVIETFADANGTLFPDGWQEHACLSNGKLKGHSLLNQASSCPGFRAFVEADENRQLQEVQRFTSGKGRIFILLHGFNNTVDEATPAYQAIEKAVRLRPDDGVIRFYWDGLTGTGVGGGRIWFYATGNSQLAGSRGLRRILNEIHNKDVYLISHSRGASVILSALGNPIYDPKFLDDTVKLSKAWGGFDRFLAPDPLQANGNRLHVMMLAPAIDRIDFCDAKDQPSIGDKGVLKPCKNFRNLGEQLVSFRYTVNALDPVLRKYVGLQYHFNPTSLGQDPATGQALRDQHYPIMKGYVFKQPQKWHAFGNYVESCEFAEMLRDEKLGS